MGDKSPKAINKKNKQSASKVSSKKRKHIELMGSRETTKHKK